MTPIIKSSTKLANGMQLTVAEVMGAKGKMFGLLGTTPRTADTASEPLEMIALTPIELAQLKVEIDRFLVENPPYEAPGSTGLRPTDL